MSGVTNGSPLPESRHRGSPSDRAAAPPSLTRVVLQVLLIIIGVALVLWVLYRLASVVLLLILAALFAYVLAPLVQLAERPIQIAGRTRHLSRGPAILLVYVLMAGGALAAAVLLLPRMTQQVDDMISGAPEYAQSIVTWEHGLSGYYQRLRLPLELRRNIDQSVVAAGEAAVASARTSALALVSALSNLPWLILIPILAFFLLKDAAGFRRTIITALPQKIRLRGNRLFDDLNATLAAFIRAQLLACLLVGSMCAIGLALLRVPYAMSLGVLAGALEFVPLVGPLLLAIVASIVAALHAPILALWTVGFLGILRIAEDYVIYPRLIGRGIQLHPLAVILAVLAGAELDGVAGMFLAVPTVAIGWVVYRHCREKPGGDGW
jgi:predicted PurR-regulated permease PerM